MPTAGDRTEPRRIPRQMRPVPATAPAHADAADLMTRVALGDSAAFTVLAARLHEPALRLAARVLGNPGDAEDAVQVALAKLWSGAARFDPARGLAEPWFRRIVVNQCLDARRRLRPISPLDAASEVASNDPDPFTAAAGNQRARALGAAMARLNPRQRAAIALFHGDGATMAEVAEALDTSPKAVEGLLSRARKELQQLLAATHGQDT